MVAATHLLEPIPRDLGEQRVILFGVTYKDYVLLSDVLGHRPGTHLTYCDGTLEIMTTSKLHEHLKKLIARLLELHALVRGVKIHGYGSATFRREEKERGLEPDECYNIGEPKEYPDLAIEVIVTSGGINKLAVHEGLGVKEVWIYAEGRFAVFALGPSGYTQREGSAFFADLDFGVLATHMQIEDQDAAVRSYFAHLKA